MKNISACVVIVFCLFLLPSVIFAQSCSGVGVKQYKPKDTCLTVERTCCQYTNQWSAWGSNCPSCDCTPGETRACSGGTQKCNNLCKWDTCDTSCTFGGWVSSVNNGASNCGSVPYKGCVEYKACTGSDCKNETSVVIGPVTCNGVEYEYVSHGNGMSTAGGPPYYSNFSYSKCSNANACINGGVGSICYNSYNVKETCDTYYNSWTEGYNPGGYEDLSYGYYYTGTVKADFNVSKCVRTYFMRKCT